MTMMSDIQEIDLSSAMLTSNTESYGSISMILITANVGSIFEDPNFLLKIWVEQFLRRVRETQASFIALHMQEVGGKNYEQSMVYVEHFTNLLCQSPELAGYEYKIFLDEDFTCTAKFTALGNAYFIRQDLCHAGIISIYDYQLGELVPFIGQEIYSGNIESVPYKRKEKFPKEYFPDCKWSRKGFMATKWSIGDNLLFQLVNIHLFHDASNLVAAKKFPSKYCEIRRKALEYTLDLQENSSSSPLSVNENDHVEDLNEDDRLPYFIFGDFNFRLDTHSLVNELTHRWKQSKEDSIPDNVDGEILKYTPPPNGDGLEEDLKNVENQQQAKFLKIGKKVFDLDSLERTFFDPPQIEWLRQFDCELNHFDERVTEFPITFPPSYPFREDKTGNHNYMKTRCPSWCDRVLMSKSAMNLILDCNGNDQDDDDRKARIRVSYTLIGEDSAMGDHKPVMLSFQLKYSNEMQPCSTRLEPIGASRHLEASCETSTPDNPLLGADDFCASQQGDMAAVTDVTPHSMRPMLRDRTQSLTTPPFSRSSLASIGSSTIRVSSDCANTAITTTTTATSSTISQRSHRPTRRAASALTAQSLEGAFRNHIVQRNEFVRRTNELFLTLRTVRALQGSDSPAATHLQTTHTDSTTTHTSVVVDAAAASDISADSLLESAADSTGLDDASAGSGPGAAGGGGKLGKLKIQITPSNRLGSHHSSSSEEWYSELGLVTPTPNNKDLKLSSSPVDGDIPADQQKRPDLRALVSSLLAKSISTASSSVCSEPLPSHPPGNATSADSTTSQLTPAEGSLLNRNNTSNTSSSPSPRYPLVCDMNESDSLLASSTVVSCGGPPQTTTDNETRHVSLPTLTNQLQKERKKLKLKKNSCILL